MEITLQEIVFYVVAATIAVCSVLAVTTGKILRATTYLLFVFVRHRSHLRHTGIYFPGSCTVDGLCRRYRGPVCILYFADTVR